MTSPTEELKVCPLEINQGFEQEWGWQQGALFLKLENSGLEWKKSLARFFWDAGIKFVRPLESKLESHIAELEGENKKQTNRIAELLRENSRFKAEFHKTKPVSKIEIENIKLKTEIERLEARIEILENPSDGRCMEIGALREEVERLKKIVENGSVTIESYGLELTQNRKQLATAKEALLDIRPRAQNYLATGIVARIDEALEKLK